MISSLYYLILVELIVVALVDLKTRKIKNYWSIFHMILSILLLVLLQYHSSIKAAYIPIVIFGTGFIGYTLKIVGAGDVKFLSTLLFIVPEVQQLAFLEALGLTVILVGFLILFYKLLINFKTIYINLLTKDWKGVKSSLSSRNPFAPIIMLAWLVWGYQINIFDF